MPDLRCGIKIQFPKNRSSDLSEIIAAIGDQILSALTWKVQLDFFVIHHESEFADVANLVGVLGQGWCHCRTDKREWSFEQIRRLSREKHQVVDGEFIGFKSTPKGKKPWVVIKAVDSSFWEVWSGDEKLVVHVRQAFSDTKDIGGGLK